MPEFQLFRIKVYLPAQLSLIHENASRVQILISAINSTPSAALRRGNIWHVGNVAPVGEDAVYFRIGRTSTATFGLFQEGRFEDAEFETAPYTHVLADLRLGLCAIARKAQLAPTTASIAKRLERLLNEAASRPMTAAQFEIAEISDPESLVTYIREAYAISRFWLTVTPPNPLDVNEDFVRPLQRALAGSNGDQAKAEIRGHDLEREVLEDLARSAASSGNDAGATLVARTEGRRVRKRLRGNSVTVEQENVDSEASRRQLLEWIRSTYNRIRGGGGAVE